MTHIDGTPGAAAVPQPGHNRRNPLRTQETHHARLLLKACVARPYASMVIEGWSFAATAADDAGWYLGRAEPQSAVVTAVET
jgi:hypothetical protein